MNEEKQKAADDQRGLRCGKCGGDCLVVLSNLLPLRGSQRW
jgi:hypothetical protein